MRCRRARWRVARLRDRCALALRHRSLRVRQRRRRKVPRRGRLIRCFPGGTGRGGGSTRAVRVLAAARDLRTDPGRARRCCGPAAFCPGRRRSIRRPRGLTPTGAGVRGLQNGSKCGRTRSPYIRPIPRWVVEQDPSGPRPPSRGLALPADPRQRLRLSPDGHRPD